MIRLKLKRPILILLMGIPGSGKTYLARRLSRQLDAAVVSGEKIRMMIVPKPSLRAEEERAVWQVAHLMTEEFLSLNISVVCDFDLNRRSQRRQIQKLAKKYQAEYLVIWQQVNRETALARCGHRDYKQPDDRYALSLKPETFEALSQLLEPPHQEKALVISGQHTFSGQSQTILRHLVERQLLSMQRRLAQSIPKPGLVNLVAGKSGRTDHDRRNIKWRAK